MKNTFVYLCLLLATLSCNPRSTDVQPGYLGIFKCQTNYLVEDLSKHPPRPLQQYIDYQYYRVEKGIFPGTISLINLADSARNTIRNYRFNGTPVDTLAMDATDTIRFQFSIDAHNLHILNDGRTRYDYLYQHPTHIRLEITGVK